MVWFVSELITGLDICVRCEELADRTQVTGVVSQYDSGQETKYPLLSLPYSHPIIILDSPGLAQSFSAEKYK